MQKNLNMEIKTKMTKISWTDLLLSLVFKYTHLFFSSEFKIINKIIRTTTFSHYHESQLKPNFFCLFVFMYEH